MKYSLPSTFCATPPTAEGKLVNPGEEFAPSVSSRAAKKVARR
jgi:hypothetical protein